ncbi:MAG TPA: SAM-dependent methyltransferase, partial [Gemmatimonadales bacterium]|nr:SAM-dependent methyltransferase [Gemmatimonadales bacterium]
MRPKGPSHTAAAVAFRRAAHQVIDHPPVFTDPIAARLLSPESQARLAALPRHRRRSTFNARLRAFLAVRSRVAEDALAAAVGAGVRQCLILGAGLDTFAYRNPWPELRVFEVDHPNTQ